MREIFDASQRVDVKQDGTVIVTDARQVNLVSGMQAVSLSGDVAAIGYKGVPVLSSGAVIVSGAQGGIDFTSGLIVELLSGQRARVGASAGASKQYATFSWGGDNPSNEPLIANENPTANLAGGNTRYFFGIPFSGQVTRIVLSEQDGANTSGSSVRMEVNGVVESDTVMSGSNGFTVAEVLNLSGNPLLVQPGDKLSYRINVSNNLGGTLGTAIVEG